MVRIECPRIIRVTKEPQGAKEIERHNKPHQDENEPPECRKQGEHAIDRLEDHVKRCKKHDHACAVNEIAGDADAKKSFVRQDIPSGFRIALDN